MITNMLVFLLSLFTIVNTSFAQELGVYITPKTSASASDIYELKVFNNLSVSIGIKASIGFSRFSEMDTLNLDIGEWRNNESVAQYSIDLSETEAHMSEQTRYHQLILVAPQTYFIATVRLLNIEKFKNSNFILFYSDEITPKEFEVFGKRSPGNVKIVKEEKHFQNRIVSIK